MLVPLSWLKDYIDLPESVEELRDLLTFSGLEVEGVETHGSDFAGIRVAEITAVDPHPDADKLTLCTVDIGGGEAMRVVCGAPNVRTGLKTIYAPVGSELPNGMKLKKAKIRGVESLGMLCAEDELGLSSDHSGIMELAEELEPGTPAAGVLGGPEVVFELEVTPNRPDCLSMIGVARELAALSGRDLRLPEATLPENVSGETIFDVKIMDPATCPRYTARLLDGASVGPSPEWMQQRLRLCGVRPINNLVDITNYVMLETGQPLHAFDRELLEGDTIIVRNAAGGEVLRTLDDSERKLTADDLVIADRDRPVALAGVMGGAHSEIRDETRTVLLESAAFAASQVRSTAKRLDAHSESSYRYARGCDVTNVEWAGRRAAGLMVDLAGAAVSGPVTDVYPGKSEPLKLDGEWERITSLIGVDIPVERMRGYFERLGLRVLSETEEGCTVEVPGFRLDLTRPVDLTEEIARLNGLDAIPVRAPVATVIPEADDHETRVEMSVWRHLARRGFLEALNYSLTTPEALEALDRNNADRRVELPNPISRDQSALRTSLIPQMVETLAFNRAHQTEELAMFEAGKIYLKTGGGVEEHSTVCLGTMGPWRRPLLDKQRPVENAEAFYDLKGEVEQLLDRLDALDAVEFRAVKDPTFAVGQSATLVRDATVIGRMGLLSAKVLRSRKLVGPVAVAELRLDAVMPGSERLKVMTPLPEHPSITRDVALIVDRAKTHRMVMDVVNGRRPKHLESVEVFDIFESGKLGGNRKSMAYRFTYRNPKKTLTDTAVEKMHEPMVERLVSELNAEIQGR